MILQMKWDSVSLKAYYTVSLGGFDKTIAEMLKLLVVEQLWNISA